jgi:hypothetical protein
MGDVPESSDVPLAHVLDVAAIEADLADVEVALERLEDGSYWTDEITGQPLSDDLLASHPTARRNTTATDAHTNVSTSSPASAPGLASSQGNNASAE